MLSFHTKARLLAVPECLGDVTSLIRLELRGNDFGKMPDIYPSEKALPASLAKLTNLRDFVAFAQSDLKCPPKGDTSCRPLYLYRAQVEDMVAAGGQSGDNP